MPGVAPFEFAFHIGITGAPEAREVARDLHGPSGGREQVQEDRHAPVRHARCFGKTEHLLKLDRKHGPIGCPIVERARAPTWHVKCHGRLSVETLALAMVEPPCQDAREIEAAQAGAAAYAVEIVS